MAVRLPEVNSVMLAGRLTRDAILQSVGASSLVEFTIAVEEWRKDNGGKTHFFNIVSWKPSDSLVGNLIKGTPVMVEGKLNHESWEKDGKRNERVRVTAYKIHLLEWKKKNEGEKGEVKPQSDDMPF